MASRLDTTRIDKAFRETEQFKNMAKVGMAAFEERLTGGFERLLNSVPSYWQPLKPKTIRQKRKLGQPPTPWIATGRTLRELSSGKLTQVGINNGAVKFAISSRGIASIVPKRMMKKIPRSKGGKTTLWGLLNYGEKNGGFRPIDWQKEDPERIRPYIEAAIAEIMKAEGLAADAK